VEINEIETNRLIQKSIDIQYCSTFSQTTQKTWRRPFGIKYGKGYVATNINEIQWLVKEYYYNTYCNKLRNSNKWVNFYTNNDLPKRSNKI
jgi:hypothetical protein